MRLKVSDTNKPQNVKRWLAAGQMRNEGTKDETEGVVQLGVQGCCEGLEVVMVAPNGYISVNDGFVAARKEA